MKITYPHMGYSYVAFKMLIADSNVPARRISTVFLLLFLSFLKRQCYNKGQI
jgi:hypothetical protein